MTFIFTFHTISVRTVTNTVKVNIALCSMCFNIKMRIIVITQLQPNYQVLSNLCVQYYAYLPKHILINCRSIFFRYADTTMLSFTSYFPSLCMHAHCRSNWWLNHLRKGQHSPKLYPNLILKKYLVFLFTLIFSHESNDPLKPPQGLSCAMRSFSLILSKCRTAHQYSWGLGWGWNACHL